MLDLSFDRIPNKKDSGAQGCSGSSALYVCTMYVMTKIHVLGNGA
jgi:hypothetical protein